MRGDLAANRATACRTCGSNYSGTHTGYSRYGCNEPGRYDGADGVYHDGRGRGTRGHWQKDVPNGFCHCYRALLAIAGIFIVAYPYLPQRRRREIVQTAQPEALTRAEPTKKLPQMSDIDFVPTSVTEGTTDLLKTPTANCREN